MKRIYRRLLRVTVIAMLVVLAVLVVAVLSATALLDVPTIKAEVERVLSKAVGGQIAWDTLYLRVLPAPHAALHGVKIDIPGAARVSVEEVDAYLRLAPLFRGRAEISSFTVKRAAVQIDIGPSPPGDQTTADQATNSDPVAVYRSIADPIAQAARQFAPDTVVELEQSSIDIQVSGIPPIQLRDLSLHARSGYKGLDVKADLAGNSWSHLRLTGRMEYSDLSGYIDVEVTDLKLQAWLDMWLAGTPLGIAIPGSSVHAKGYTDAKTSLGCDFELGVPSIDVRWDKRHMNIPDSSVKGTAVTSLPEIAVALSDVRLGTLVPAGSATLKMIGPQGSPQLTAEIPRLDLAQLRDAALALVGDYNAGRPAAQQILIRSGAATDVRFAAKADSWSDLFDLDHMTAGLTLEDGALVVPVIQQPATAIAARVELADGKLGYKAVGAQLGRSMVTDGSGQYSLQDGSLVVDAGFDLNLPQALELTTRVAPDARAGLKEIESPSGQLKGRASFSLKQAWWHALVDIHESDASVRLRQLPWRVALRQGNVSASPNGVNVAGVRGSIGASTFSDVAAQLTFGRATQLAGAAGHVKLAVGEVYPWLRSQEGLAKSLQDIPAVAGTVDVTLNRLAGNLDQPSSLGYDVTLQPRQLSAEIKGLPGAVMVQTGSIRIDPATVQLDGVAVAMLDTKATVSGKVSGYQGKRPQAQASVADGSIGEKFVAWLWRKIDVPERLRPKTPVRFSAKRVAWGPDRALEAQAVAQFEQGQNVAADLSWKPGTLEFRSLTLKDERSNAVIAFLMQGDMVEAKFTGTLWGSSISAMLKSPGEHPGHASGDLSLTLDRTHRERSTASGYLKGEQLNLTPFVGQPVKIDRIDLAAEGAKVHIHEATVNWAQQVVTFKGEVTNGEKGPIIDGELDSKGVLVDALLPAQGPKEPEDQPSAEEHTKQPPGESKDLAKIWPLPVTGHIQIRSDFIQYQHYRVAPLSATLTLEEYRAHIDVNQAKLCGISFPLTVEATPQVLAGSVVVTARKETVKDIASCFSEERLLLTGQIDIDAALSTQGKIDELVRNLEGTVRVEVRDGLVMKMALLGNILSMKNIAGLLQKGTPKFGSEGFPYRRLLVKGHLDQGNFVVEEGVFDSSAVGIVTTGAVNILDHQANLTVLVAPFTNIDRLVRAVPIIGYVLGGVLTSIPVGVHGDYTNPTVIPLGPRAVTSDLLGVFSRAIQVPGKLVAPLESDSKAKVQPAQQ